VKSGITAIAYETVEVNRFLPLLAPMSEVAGRMSIQVGAAALQRPNGRSWCSTGGVPGVAPGKVVILGGGSVGVSAAAMAIGLRADVTLLDINLKRLGEIDEMFHGQVKTVASSPYSIEQYCIDADLCNWRSAHSRCSCTKTCHRCDGGKDETGFSTCRCCY
jgi:alanine dehydrogenase